MEPYFIFLFFILLCYFFDSTTNQKNKFFKILVFVGLALFAGFRLNVGIDYESYVKIYYGIEGHSLSEPGSVYMVKLINKIGGTEHLYFLIMAIITEFFVYQILIKEKKYFWLLVLMYYCISIFYLASFNGVRNFTAIAIMIWALRYVESGNFKLFAIISVATAFMFHYSALIFLPLYFYLRRQNSVTQILVISVAVFLGGSILFRLLDYTPYAKYEALMGNNDIRENKVEIIHYLFAAISLALILIGKDFKYFKENSILYNMNTLSFYTILMVIHQSAGSFVMLFQRFNNYFLFSFLLIIPTILSSMKKDNRTATKVVLILFAFAYFIRTIVFKGEHHMLVPYNYDFTLFAH